MESKLTLHFLFFITFCPLHLSLNAQGINSSDCQELSIQANTIAACATGSEGEIKLTISQGLPPYTISWADGKQGESRKVREGIYQVSVTDALGCQTTKELTVKSNTEITVAAQVKHASKPGKSNGEINLVVGGGMAPYRYTWISSSQGVLHAAVPGLTRVKKLPSGIYQVLVFDDAGCYAEIETEVR